MVAEAVRLTASQLHQRASAQHSLKREATQVVPATAKCAEVVKTADAIGTQKVVPSVSHATVRQVLLVVRSTVTSVQLAATETTAAHVVVLTATIVLVVRSMVTVVHVASLIAMSVHVVNLVRSVRLAVMATIVRVVHSMATVVRVVSSAQTARLVRLMAVVVPTPVAMLVAQTAWSATQFVSAPSTALVSATAARRLS
jgi:hypothetical protein